ncbi:MAG: hemolysin III family protein [archaeon]
MKNNEPLSSLSHFIMFLLSIAGLVLLIIRSLELGTIWHVVSFSIFGSSLILLYLTSALYHFFPVGSKSKRIFKKMDHSFIYLLIAGTYTPICLTVLRGGLGWSIFGIVWGFALLGVIIKSTNLKINGWISTLTYILMGWTILIALSPLIDSVDKQGIILLFAGGIFYTTGTIFFGLGKMASKKRLFGMHEIFHFFVAAGSFSHFWFMLKYLI